MDVGHLAHEDARARAVGRAATRRSPPREERGGRLDTRAHERVGELRPGDADPDLLERLDSAGSKSVRARRASARRRRRRGPSARRVVARRQRPAAVERDEPVRRLEADDAAAGGGDPDRAAGVGTERRVGEPGVSAAADPPLEPPATRPGRAGSARRRSAGSPRSCRTRTRAGSSCRRSRSRPPRAAHRGGRRAGTWSAKIGGAVGRLEPGRVEQVLDRQPDARAGRLRLSQEDASVEREVEERDAEGAGEEQHEEAKSAQPRSRFFRSSSGVMSFRGAPGSTAAATNSSAR